ncbi:hypothetical protein ACHAQA_004027 [Verticillium albo-atrum]
MSSEYLTTSFVGGWATVLAIAGAVGYNYYQKQKPAAAPSKNTQVPWSPPKKNNRAKKQRQEAYATAAQSAPRDETPREEPAATSSKKKERDEDEDNKAFARQMSGVKEGMKFSGNKAGGDKNKNKQKSVKQSRAAEPTEVSKPVELTPAVAEEAPAQESSSSSSNADADDDRSPEVRPVDASGVSDMLEPATGGPSVLRLTDTDKQKSKPKVAKVVEPAETKKQRQNRRKVEERKIAREEEEKLRKVAMEKQRRGAREAAGIPAKDGSQFMAATNGGKSAWKAGSPNGQQESKKETIDVQPLDTFETTTTNGTAASIAPARNQKGESWKASALSEEEQIELLKEEDEWATVPTKSAKKAKKTQGSDTEAAPPSAPPKEARPVPQPIVNAGASKSNSAKANQSYGSFSALSSKADDNAAEEELEWDV